MTIETSDIIEDAKAQVAQLQTEVSQGRPATKEQLEILAETLDGIEHEPTPFTEPDAETPTPFTETTTTTQPDGSLPSTR